MSRFKKNFTLIIFCIHVLNTFFVHECTPQLNSRRRRAPPERSLNPKTLSPEPSRAREGLVQGPLTHHQRSMKRLLRGCLPAKSHEATILHLELNEQCASSGLRSHQDYLRIACSNELRTAPLSKIIRIPPATTSFVPASKGSVQAHKGVVIPYSTSRSFK